MNIRYTDRYSSISREFFENAHPWAKRFMNDAFFFSPIEETAPFGSDDGADAYAGFAGTKLKKLLKVLEEV